MILFLSLFLASISSLTIPRDIGYIAPPVDLEKDNTITVSTFYHTKVVIAITQKSPNVKINYTSPVGSKNTQIFEGNSIFLPNGDSEFQIFIPKGESIILAYASISRMSCDKIEVCTKSSLTKVFKHESQNTDFCLLFAPSSQESRFCVNSTNLGNDQLYVYNHVMNNAWYDKYTADEAAGWSVTSNRPWLFRFETDSEKHDEHFIEILAKSTKEMPNFALEYENVPESAKIPPPGVLKHNYLIPILGCAAPVILMGSWLYAVITLFGKPPAKPPSFNSNVDENYRNDNVENNVLDIE